MYQFFAAYILVTSLLASRSEAVTDTGVGYLHKLSVTQVSNGVRMSYLYDEVFLCRMCFLKVQGTTTAINSL